MPAVPATQAMSAMPVARTQQTAGGDAGDSDDARVAGDFRDARNARVAAAADSRRCCPSLRTPQARRRRGRPLPTLTAISTMRGAVAPMRAMPATLLATGASGSGSPAGSFCQACPVCMAWTACMACPACPASRRRQCFRYALDDAAPHWRRGRRGSPTTMQALLQDAYSVHVVRSAFVENAADHRPRCGDAWR